VPLALPGLLTLSAALWRSRAAPQGQVLLIATSNLQRPRSIALSQPVSYRKRADARFPLCIRTVMTGGRCGAAGEPHGSSCDCSTGSNP
jgi:hypothetical protein